MNYSPTPPLELGIYWDKVLPSIRKRKFTSILLYIFALGYFSIPSFQIPVLQYNNFRVTSLMEQRAIENYLLFYPRQSWIDIDNVNHNTLRAIISMEDGSFFRHKGIDWKEMKKSLRINQRRGRSVRGGSTITMQTAKNLFLSTHKNILRKGKELLISFRMEKELPKKAILESYINAIEWGDGIFGLKKAASVYFDKDPVELTINESSRLAAVIPSPLVHPPNVNSRYVLRRSSIIRGRLGDVALFPGE